MAKLETGTDLAAADYRAIPVAVVWNEEREAGIIGQWRGSKKLLLRVNKRAAVAEFIIRQHSAKV